MVTTERKPDCIASDAPGNDGECELSAPRVLHAGGIPMLQSPQPIHPCIDAAKDVAGIHVLISGRNKLWMAGTKPGHDS